MGIEIRIWSPNHTDLPILEAILEIARKTEPEKGDFLRSELNEHRQLESVTGTKTPAIDLSAFAAGAVAPLVPFPGSAPIGAGNLPPPPPSAIEGAGTPPAPPAPPVGTGIVPPAGTGGGVELDTKGLPWDGRIHARTKAKISDGTWRTRRGVSDAVLAQVEAELRAAQAAPGNVSAPVASNPPKGAPAPSATGATTGAQTGAPPPPPPVSPPPAGDTGVSATGAAAPATGAVALDFPTFMKVIAGNIATRPQVMNEAIEKAAARGIPSLPALVSRPDLLPHILADLGIQWPS